MAKKTWQLAASFDTAYAYRSDGSILDETVYAQHHVRKEEHYKLARDYFGFSKFRDGIAWSRIITGSCQINDSRFESEMNHLVNLSMVDGNPQIDLIIHHYGIPLIRAEHVRDGRMADFLCDIAERVSTGWPRCFSGYVTSVENGYATAMQTDLGHWHYSASTKEKPLTWWELFEARMRASIAMSKVFKTNDPATRRIACEPFYKSESKFKDQLRPLRCLLGSPDKMARRYSPSCTDQWGGEPELLTDVGLNFYGNQNDDFFKPAYPLSWLLERAKKRFPDHQLRIAETGTCQVTQLGITPEQWLEMLDEQIKLANEKGVSVETVTWAPFLPIEDFELAGKKSPGSLMESQKMTAKTKRLAKIVSQYT